MDTADSFSNLDDEDTSTNEDKVNANTATEADFGVIPNVAIEITVDEILRKLAMKIDMDSISKFNISRNFIWEGTKRVLSRKSFSPNNKVSVKFTDDVGNMGGPMKEYFTLVTQWILTSHLFCGSNHA